MRRPNNLKKLEELLLSGRSINNFEYREMFAGKTPLGKIVYMLRQKGYNIKSKKKKTLFNTTVYQYYLENGSTNR